MEPDYKPNADMQTILKFLDAECTYAEREGDYIATAKEMLEYAGWVFDIRSIEDDFFNHKVYIYNKYRLTSEELIQKYSSYWICVKPHYKLLVANAIEQHINVFKNMPNRELSQKIIDKCYALEKELVDLRRTCGNY